MTGPLGKGERRHPRAGNTTLVTRSLSGAAISTPLWINQFSTDLNLQIDSAQLRGGLSHRPIRLAERFLIFSTIWNVADRKKYEKLIDKIRAHWAFNLNEDIPTPMRLSYYGANKRWRGFIEGASIGYAVTDVILTYQFNMRIIPDVADKFSRVVGGDAPYAPTSQDVNDFGDAWFSLGELKEEVAIARREYLESEGKSVAKNPDQNPTSTGSRQQR